MLHKAWNSKGDVPYCFPRSSIKFQGHRGQNITNFDPNWAFPDYRPVAAFKSLRFALLNLGLCAACWARFMCHHELWPTSVSHPFSSLNSSLGFAGGKHYQKITILIFRLVVQNFAIPGCFPYIFFSMAIFSPYFLLVGLLLQSVALFQSLSLKKFMEMSLNFIWRCLFEPCYCCMQYLTVIAAHNCYQIEAAWHWARSGAQTIHVQSILS